MEKYRSGHNGPDSKSGSLVRGSWVRIPPSPPNTGMPPFQVVFLYLKIIDGIRTRRARPSMNKSCGLVNRERPKPTEMGGAGRQTLRSKGCGIPPSPPNTEMPPFQVVFLYLKIIDGIRTEELHPAEAGQFLYGTYLRLCLRQSPG